MTAWSNDTTQALWPKCPVTRAMAKLAQHFFARVGRYAGEALCGGAGFCWGFWTPNWCPEKSLFSIP